MFQLLNPFRRLLLLAALPTALLSACGDNDDDGPAPEPDKGRVVAYHFAPQSSVAAFKFLIDNTEVKQMNYGEGSGYQTTTAGSHTLAISTVQTNTAAFSQTQTIAKDKSYSLFAYNPTTSNTPPANALFVEDNLTAPTAGNAKIRLVHLGLGAASPVKLNGSLSNGTITSMSADVTFGAASAFMEVTPNTYSLYLTNNNVPQPITINRTLVAGKIYTIVVQGSSTALTTDTQLKLVSFENN